MRVSSGELEAIDCARGGVPREQWIRRVLAEAARLRLDVLGSTANGMVGGARVEVSERVSPGVVVMTAGRHDGPVEGAQVVAAAVGSAPAWVCPVHPSAGTRAAGMVVVCAAAGCTRSWVL